MSLTWFSTIANAHGFKTHYHQFLMKRHSTWDANSWRINKLENGQKRKIKSRNYILKIYNSSSKPSSKEKKISLTKTFKELKKSRSEKPNKRIGSLPKFKERKWKSSENFSSPEKPKASKPKSATLSKTMLTSAHKFTQVSHEMALLWISWQTSTKSNLLRLTISVGYHKLKQSQKDLCHQMSSKKRKKPVWSSLTKKHLKSLSKT